MIVPDIELEELRSLFSRRIDRVKDLRRIKSRIKVQSLYYGVMVFPEFDNDYWSQEFRNCVNRPELLYGATRECLASEVRDFRLHKRSFGMF